MNWDAFFTTWAITGGVVILVAYVWGLAELCAMTQRRFNEPVAWGVLLAGVGLLFSLAAGVFA